MSWFHSQNLNERNDGTCGSMLRQGRCWWCPWWNPEQDRNRGVVFYFSWHFLTNFYHIHLNFGDDDEDDVQFSFACGLFAVWLTIGNLGWKWLPRNRQCEIAYHNAALWIHPWSKSMEWCRDDQWWVRGLTIHMPWDWTHVRHQVMRPDGKLVDSIDPWKLKPRDDGTYGLETEQQGDGREVWMAPYRYVLKNGEVQDRTATIHVDEREWRWRWFTWLPWPRRIRRSVEIKFSDEVGEQTGSWKGGCVGCGYDLQRGEHPLDSLKRMERERVFD